jgi:ATP-dependent DNA helicase RecQ
MDTTTAPRLTDDRAAVADRVITAMAGADARLRPDQETAVAGLCAPAARVLVVQATGWGKSAVYWAATAIRRAEGHGPTLVVSPLLSLMRDQVAAAARAGLRAATLNSSNVDAWGETEQALLGGDIDVLLVSPERLANPGFGRRVLDGLAGRLGMLVIDEAHAVSDWGHDFRPDYRRVSDMLQRLNPETPVLATTATANARVTEDVARQLGGLDDADHRTLVLRGQLARASLQLSVVPRLTPLQRYAWVVDQLPRLPGSGIVYTLTVADAERLAAAIADVHGAQVPVAAYTGKLDGAEREQLEDALRRNELKALVATSALGMGYDKPDLGFVVHVGAPPSPVSYYQQVGRAGRAIDHAHAVLLPSDGDAGVWDYFATATIPKPDQVERVLAVLSSEEPMSVVAVEAESGVRRTRVELMLKQLAVDGVVERVERGWVSTGKPWEYDAAHYDGVVEVRRREADIMRAYIHSERCLMELLQASLDDPHAEPCGRCSVCRDGLPDELLAAPDPETTKAVARVLRRQVHHLEPRKMWPGGVFGSRGRIPAEEAHETGRTLIHADAPEWRDAVTAMFQRDAAAPGEVKDASVRLLAGWRQSWSARPEVVLDLPAGGYPVLTASVADHIADVGRLQRAGFVGPDRSEVSTGSTTGGVVGLDHPEGSGLDRLDQPAVTEMTSAEEAAYWRDTLPTDSVPAEVAGRVVLLIVDATSSLWPITVASAALRRAGAHAVLPLLLHRRP